MSALGHKSVTFGEYGTQSLKRELCIQTHSRALAVVSQK